MTKLFSTLRKHLHFIIIVPLIIIVLTWPTFLHVFETETFWLPTGRNDIFNLFWDAWYAKLVAFEDADFFYTDRLFYPNGVSLAYHNFSLPHMIVFGGLRIVMPAANAFNLTYLLLVFVTVSSAYVYLRYLFRDKWISVFGAIVFGTSSFVLSRPATPHISFIAAIPLSLYFFHRAILEDRLSHILMSAALLGLQAWIGLYTLVCLLLMFMLYIVYFTSVRWHKRSFWTKLGVFLFIAGAICLVRIVPMVTDFSALIGVLEKYHEREIGRDLLGYFVNYEHPITTPVLSSLFNTETIELGWPQTVYLGYAPLLLIALGLARSSFRNRMLPWLLLALPFVVLRLGSTLLINDVVYEFVRLPKYYLEQLFPYIFQPFWEHGPISCRDRVAIYSLGLSWINDAIAVHFRKSSSSCHSDCRRDSGLRVLSGT